MDSSLPSQNTRTHNMCKRQAFPSQRTPGDRLHIYIETDKPSSGPFWECTRRQIYKQKSLLLRPFEYTGGRLHRENKEAFLWDPGLDKNQTSLPLGPFSECTSVVAVNAITQVDSQDLVHTRTLKIWEMHALIIHNDITILHNKNHNSRVALLVQCSFNLLTSYPYNAFYFYILSL